MTIKTAGLLLGLLALSACQPLPLADPGPATGALYRLPLNLPALYQATDLRALPGAQSARSPLTDLRFELVSASTLVEQGRGRLHVSATYRVNNPSSVAVRAPLYVPAVLGGGSATQGETPFTGITTRKGQLLEVNTLVAEQARLLDSSGLWPDPQAPALVEVTVTPILDLPTDTHLNRLASQGFRGPSLPAGGSAPVTFAAVVPLQGADVGDRDPFYFSLILTVLDQP